MWISHRKTHLSLNWVTGVGGKAGGLGEVLAQEPHKPELALQGPPLWVSSSLISELHESMRKRL